MRAVYRCLWFVSMAVLIPFAVCGVLADIGDEFILQPLNLKATREKGSRS